MSFCIPSTVSFHFLDTIRLHASAPMAGWARSCAWLSSYENTGTARSEPDEEEEDAAFSDVARFSVADLGLAGAAAEAAEDAEAMEADETAGAEAAAAAEEADAEEEEEEAAEVDGRAVSEPLAALAGFLTERDPAEVAGRGAGSAFGSSLMLLLLNDDADGAAAGPVDSAPIMESSFCAFFASVSSSFCMSELVDFRPMT